MSHLVLGVVALVAIAVLSTDGATAPLAGAVLVLCTLAAAALSPDASSRGGGVDRS